MAISVNQVKIRVETLAVKSQNGYASSTDFNSDLRDANLTLFEFYIKQFEETERILDAIEPFVIESTLSLTLGQLSATTPFPADYAHKIEVGVLKVTNNPKNDCGGKGCKKSGCHSCGTKQAKPQTILPPITQPYPCDYLLSNEEKYTLSSPIRKPSIEKNIYRHSFKNGLIHVYPKETSSIYFKYFKLPPTPFWGSTDVSTPDGDFQQFDPSTTIDMGFPEQEFSNVVDLMMLYLGIEIRETPLIQFAKMKQTQPLIQ